ncbi:MAG: GAF domain-containing protein, partial [Chloroflexota bacterium]
MVSSSSDEGTKCMLVTLQRLLAIETPELRSSLDQASSLVAEAMHADKVDIFLYEAESDSLVAFGTSDTEIGREQRRAGLDRLPVANNSPSVHVFQTGVPYLNGRIDLDPTQPPGMVQRLNLLSEIDVPLTVNGERRGIVQVDSHQPDFFGERDLEFLTAVAGWIGMVTHRAELFKLATVEAERRGERRFADDLARITHRERLVASLIAEGMSNAEIA